MTRRAGQFRQSNISLTAKKISQSRLSLSLSSDPRWKDICRNETPSIGEKAAELCNGAVITAAEHQRNAVNVSQATGHSPHRLVSIFVFPCYCSSHCSPNVARSLSSRFHNLSFLIALFYRLFISDFVYPLRILLSALDSVVEVVQLTFLSIFYICALCTTHFTHTFRH